MRTLIAVILMTVVPLSVSAQPGGHQQRDPEDPGLKIYPTVLGS